MHFRIMLNNGRLTGPEFTRYQDAFNYRVRHNLVGARIVERI